MTEKRPSEQLRKPRGFSPGTTGAAGANAHEQGWQLNEEERSNIAKSLVGKTGGTDYNYGAQDFGDTPEDMSSLRSETSPVPPRPQSKEGPRMVSVKPRGRGRG